MNGVDQSCLQTDECGPYEKLESHIQFLHPLQRCQTKFKLDKVLRELTLWCLWMELKNLMVQRAERRSFFTSTCGTAQSKYVTNEERVCTTLNDLN